MRLTQRVPFAASLIHTVIADVAAYPLFIPGVKGARIIPIASHSFDADLDVEFLGKNHTYRSHVTITSDSIYAKAHTIMGELSVMWTLKQGQSDTLVSFHLITTIPGFDWLMPRALPTRIMKSFIKRCEDIAQ